MKEFLSHKGVQFTVRLVDEDDQAYDELLALGFRTIPLTLIDGTAIKGFDPGALAKAIEAGGQLR